MSSAAGLCTKWSSTPLALVCSETMYGTETVVAACIALLEVLELRASIVTS